MVLILVAANYLQNQVITRFTLKKLITGRNRSTLTIVPIPLAGIASFPLPPLSIARPSQQPARIHTSTPLTDHVYTSLLRPQHPLRKHDIERPSHTIPSSIIPLPLTEPCSSSSFSVQHPREFIENRGGVQQVPKGFKDRREKFRSRIARRTRARIRGREKKNKHAGQLLS